ncbi:phosphotransferase [Chryseobacterium sp. MYb264]|uniref:phosphotransferase n=1 Tax=Chryseobacterium sp. MYb264 TaxID=2745153 RepID=UPI002E12CF05|nr:phosphotransferase [Chryseobacterium sp. MYb264]
MSTFPVIASILSETELAQFIKEKYLLKEDSNCQLFRTGVNHTYFISDNEKKYVVRIYCKNWRTKSEIQEELQLLLMLKDNDLAVSYPLPDKNGNLIQEINAPEGLRYAVLFTFAEGKKMRFMHDETCFAIGEIMAKIHNLTAGKKINRIDYNSEVLLDQAYDNINSFFAEDLEEMQYIRKISPQITQKFNEITWSENQKGIVHLDIWYDNLSVNKEDEIIIFDFDNCGNGALILDVAYFCKQLFFIESDKEEYERKFQSFINGYQQIRSLSDKEIKLIPEAGASVFIFYIGVQAKRFDWSNIFFTENYLKMFVGRIKNWMDYYETEK